MFNKNSSRGRTRGSQPYGYLARNRLPSPNPTPSTHLRQNSGYNNTFGYNPLFLAVHNGNLKLAHSLMQTNSVDDKVNGKTLMHVAAAKGHDQLVCLLSSRNARVDIGDMDGNTPLHIAVKESHKDVINLILNENTVNLKNKNNETPLHIATAKNYFPSVEKLLKNGSNPNIQDKNGETPLHVVLQRKNFNLKIVNALLDHDASGNILSRDKVTPLFIAVSLENIDVIKAFISRGTSIDILNKDGISPLVLAIQKKNPEIVKHLLEGDRNTEFENTKKMTPLHYAAQCGNEEVVQLLITKGYDNFNGKNDDFKTPLFYAAVNGHSKIVELLIKNGSEIESATVEERSLLHLCIVNNRIDVLAILINNGANVDVKTWQAETPLHYSVSNDRLNILKYLIKRGADIHAKTLSGETPLYLAVKAGREEIVEELVKWGANLRSLEIRNGSIVTLAVQSRKKKIVQLCLTEEIKEKMVIPQSELESDENFLHMAAKNGDDQILKILIESGCPFKVNWKGKNALHVAAMFGHLKSVEVLIKAGADINSKTKHFETPLHLAAASGRSSVVKFLLDKGALIERLHVLHEHATPLECALNRKRHEDIRQKRSIHERSRGIFNNDVNVDSDWCVTPYKFERYLEVTEMLLIKNDLAVLRTECVQYLKHACKIRISNENLQNKFVGLRLKEETSSATGMKKPQSIAKDWKFQPEIVRCILNYLNETLIICKLETLVGFAAELKVPDLIDVFLEYDIHQSCHNFKINCDKSDPKTILALIDHIQDIGTVYDLLYSSTVQADVQRFPNVSRLRQVSGLTGSSTLEQRLENERRRIREIDFLESLVNVLNDKLVLNKNTYHDVLKLLIAHLVQLRSVSKNSISPDSKELKILENYNLNDWYEQCEIQIINMREATVHHEYDLTFYDVLTKPVDKISNYVVRKDLLKILELSYRKFPAYSKFLERSVEKAKARRDAVDSSADCLLNVISKNYKLELPSLIVDKIFKYLSIVDLRKLAAAGRLIYKKPLYSRKNVARKRK